MSKDFNRSVNPTYPYMEEPIVPNSHIGVFRLGSSPYELLLQLANHHYHVQKVDNGAIISAFPYRIWIDQEKNRVTQLLVEGTFQGKFLGKVGIGSNFSDVVSLAESYYEELDVYMLDEHPGICFELGDTVDEEWDELKASIVSISIFDST